MSLAYSIACAKRRKEAERFLLEYRRLVRRQYVPCSMVAPVEIALGNMSKAFWWIDRALKERSDWLTFVAVDPRLAPIRSSPQFATIVKQMGIHRFLAPKLAATMALGDKP